MEGGLLAEGLLLSCPDAEFVGEGDGANGDRPVVGGEDPADLASQCAGCGTQRWREDDLDVGVGQRVGPQRCWRDRCELECSRFVGRGEEGESCGGKR